MFKTKSTCPSSTRFLSVTIRGLERPSWFNTSPVSLATPPPTLIILGDCIRPIFSLSKWGTFSRYRCH